MPNVYVIGEVDLSDRARFRGSPDLVSYAIQRGWFEKAGIDLAMEDGNGSNTTVQLDQCAEPGPRRGEPRRQGPSSSRPHVRGSEQRMCRHRSHYSSPGNLSPASP